jgi:ADP-dependent NAD(P)H-hydrate dehydratase / NAD(P)H-hydrate epimerase
MYLLLKEQKEDKAMRSQAKNLYIVEQIRQLEKLAVVDGTSGDELMGRAGKAAFEVLKEYWSDAKSVVVFCGGGNNGGDGYVVAHLAHEAGLTVEVCYIGNLAKLKGEAKNAMQQCKDAGIAIRPFDNDELSDVDIFVDALLGIGLQGEVRADAACVIQYINEHDGNVLAIDIPSGLNADSGEVLGCAVAANCTVTFIGKKQGLVTGQAMDCCGNIVCDDLAIEQELFNQIKPNARLITVEHFQQILPPRLRTAHKGYFGHVLVIGGDCGMTGAPRMAAMGAARVGAGMVTIATRKDHACFMNIEQPELMSYGVETKEDLVPLLERATVVVIGPGIGQTEWAKRLFATVLEFNLPMVVDADALNLLAAHPLKRTNWILTPHPGEASRLLNTATKVIQKDRYNAALKLQQQYGGVCLLKGAGSIVVDEEQRISVCTEGNPGMASGGMGDLLSGIIAGLIAQGMPLAIAACFGMCLHARAGDLAVEEISECGLLATDLLPFVAQVV